MTTSLRLTVITNFTNKSTAAEVLKSINLAGKRVLVTGGASGIGLETVRALAAQGASVTIAARDLIKAEEVKKFIVESTGNPEINVLHLDLSSLAKVESAAREFLERYDELHILVNNAGVMACPYGETEEGFELQFGSNYVGHFYFTKLLMPALLRARPARIVSLTSMAHRMSPIVFKDILYKQRLYEKWQAYGQSKTANALFAVALNNRFSNQGVEAFAVHPGAIATPLGRHLKTEEIEQITKDNDDANNTGGEDRGGIKTVEQGAATSCYAAAHPELAGRGGIYLEDCNPAERVPADSNLRGGVRDFAIDPEQAERLWQVTEEMLVEKLKGWF